MSEPGDSGVPEGPLGLALDLYGLLQRKDGNMGDLLQLMQPNSGEETAVEEASEKVVALQSDVNECVRRLIKGIRQSEDGGGARDRITGRPPNKEAEDLRASLNVVTLREKERVEGLQAQLDMLRQELRDCRTARSREQALTAAAESQASQMKAALTCAEGDLAALQAALDQELVRAQRLRSRVVELEQLLSAAQGQLEEEVRARRERKREEKENRMAMPPLAVHALHGAPLANGSIVEGSGLGGGTGGHVRTDDWSQDEQQNKESIDAYVLGRKGQLEATQKKRNRVRPASADSQRRHAVARADVSQMVAPQMHRIPTASPTPPNNPNSSAQDHSVDWSNTSLSRTPSLPSLPQDPQQPPRKPPIGAVSESLYKPAKQGPRKQKVDTTTLGYLRSRVAAGVVNASTPLQLAVEFCGRSSFSLRHDEERYNVLAEQLVAAAYQSLRDRWVTVLKNAEQVDNKGTTKAPRLGSFEVELLWADENNAARRTMLHSKLKTRLFPNVVKLVDGLSEALNAPASTEEGGIFDDTFAPEYRAPSAAAPPVKPRKPSRENPARAQHKAPASTVQELVDTSMHD